MREGKSMHIWCSWEQWGKWGVDGEGDGGYGPQCLSANADIPPALNYACAHEMQIFDFSWANYYKVETKICPPITNVSRYWKLVIATPSISQQ